MNNFKTQSTLMSHQTVGMNRARGREAFAYLMEMGTGKTCTVLAEFQERVSSKDLMDLLVIAPKGCIRNWYVDRDENNPSEITKHLDPRLRKDLVVASSASNAAGRDARAKLLVEKKYPRALFINVESLSGNARMLSTCKDFLASGRAMMVIDESTTIKSRKSQRTVTITKLGKLAKVRRILSGLATPRSPMDLHAQFSFLDEDILGKSFTLFRARYAKMTFICRAANAIVDAQLRKMLLRHRRSPDEMAKLNRDARIALCYALGGWIPDTAPMVAGYQHLTELRDRIAPHCYRVRKEECLDLPPKIYELRDVEFTEDQKRIYKEVLENATSQLSKLDHVTPTNAMEQILRLHQVCCGHVRTEEGVIVDVPSKRTAALLEALEDHDGKVIVWVAYDRELRKLSDALAEEYGPQSVARFWGGNVRERDEDEKRFLTQDACRFMVSTPAAGGRGNNWTVADLVIYAANDWNLEHRIQSEDRAHRKGQTKPVTYIDIGIPGTVEEKIINSLRSKMDLASEVIGEKLRSWLVPPK
jgi:SNF2 family DNA or RNA helicase